MQTINTYYKDFNSLKQFVIDNTDILLGQDKKAILVQVFSGIIDKHLLTSISRQIRDLIPQAQIIGATTNGEIMDGVVSGLSIVLSFSVFKQSNVRPIFAEKNSMTDQQLGRSIASQINTERAKVLILFATGLTVNGSQLLMGIQSVNPDLPVAGGNAGDNMQNTQCFVVCNEKISDCGVAGAVLEGEELTISQNSHLGWQAIGKEMTITRSEGARVYTIDDIPAYQVYRRYLGFNEDGDVLNGLEFPLLICKPSLYVCRPPFLRYDDDSLAFFGDIEQGEKVRFSFGHLNMILQQVELLLQTIRRQPVQSIFVYSCIARRSLLQDSAQIETLPLQDLSPSSGFFTLGEFFHADRSNQFLNNTMTTLAISETGTIKKADKSQSYAVGYTEPVGKQVNSPTDNVINRSLVILKTMTYLVDTVTNELNQRTVELQNVNEQLKYTSTHDALTGLYNRGFFEQQLIEMGSPTTGIIICDVDGLKLVNDIFGHNMGDALLMATANILKSISQPKDVVARIGGDEFAILLSNSSQADMENYYHRLGKAIKGYNRENPSVPLSISIGFSCSENGAVSVGMLFKDADDKMYREKLHRRNSITHNDLLKTLMRTLEAKDVINTQHNQHLQDLMIAFALDMGIPRNNLADLRLLTHYYDIGKVGISDDVLFNPNPLTYENIKELMRHCEIGYRIALSSADLSPIADWILKHHEWWNGQGYPLGLKGIDIPLECRMLAIVDAYSIMLSDCPYHKAMSHQAAIVELKRCAGTQFDPDLVDSFVNMMNSRSLM